MTHENTGTPNQDSGQAERAVYSDYEAAHEAIEREIFLGETQAYRLSTEVFGERWVDGRRILEVAEQPHIDLDEVVGAELAERLSEEEVKSLETLGIEAESLVTLSYAAECDQRDGEGRAHYIPGSTILVVSTPFTDKEGTERLETRTFGISIDRTFEPPKARGTYGRAFETLEGSDMEDFDLGAMMLRELMKGGEIEAGKAFAENKDAVIDSVDTARSMRDYLYADEAQAVAVVASHFSQ